MQIPQRILEEIAKWEIKKESPYSEAVYNCRDKSWSNDPPGHLRAARHWNYTTSDGSVHARTNIPVPKGYWAIGRWNEEKHWYEIQIMVPPVSIQMLQEMGITVEEAAQKAFEIIEKNAKKIDDLPKSKKAYLIRCAKQRKTWLTRRALQRYFGFSDTLASCVADYLELKSNGREYLIWRIADDIRLGDEIYVELIKEQTR